MLRYTNSHPCWPGVLRLVECSVNFRSECMYAGNYHYIQIFTYYGNALMCSTGWEGLPHKANF